MLTVIYTCMYLGVLLWPLHNSVILLCRRFLLTKWNPPWMQLYATEKQLQRVLLVSKTTRDARILRAWDLTAFIYIIEKFLYVIMNMADIVANSNCVSSVTYAIQQFRVMFVIRGTFGYSWWLHLVCWRGLVVDICLSLILDMICTLLCNAYPCLAVCCGVIFFQISGTLAPPQWFFFVFPLVTLLIGYLVC